MALIIFCFFFLRVYIYTATDLMVAGVYFLNGSLTRISGHSRHSRQAGHRLGETERGGGGQDVRLRGGILGRHADHLAEDQAETMGALQRTAFVAIGQGQWCARNCTNRAGETVVFAADVVSLLSEYFNITKPARTECRQ